MELRDKILLTPLAVAGLLFPCSFVWEGLWWAFAGAIILFVLMVIGRELRELQ